MFWNKKDEKKLLPDFPDKPSFGMPTFPKESKEEENEDSDETIEKHNLPAFPDSPLQRGFSQSAIKDAVGSDEESSFPVEKKFQATEIEEDVKPSIPSIKSNDSTSYSSSITKASRGIIKPQKTNDVFVKIEKFYSAKKNLESVKFKLSEIEDTLKKIRDIKMREEQELS